MYWHFLTLAMQIKSNTDAQSSRLRSPCFPLDGLHVSGSPRSIQISRDSKPVPFSHFFVSPAVLQDINDQFAPLTKRFSIYCFWEQFKTPMNDSTHDIVERESAVPLWTNIEQAGSLASVQVLCHKRRQLQTQDFVNQTEASQ